MTADSSFLWCEDFGRLGLPGLTLHRRYRGEHTWR